MYSYVEYNIHSENQPPSGKAGGYGYANEAIEAKVTAEQNALAAKNKLDQVKYEATQAIEAAKGKAQALQIEATAINTNPQIIQLRAIEKWDGKLPQVTGAATPFVNIK